MRVSSPKNPRLQRCMHRHIYESALLYLSLKCLIVQIVSFLQNVCQEMQFWNLKYKQNSSLLPWNPFFPRIFLKCKDRTCNYNTPEIKYNKLDHFSAERIFAVFLTIHLSWKLTWRDEEYTLHHLVRNQAFPGSQI